MEQVLQLIVVVFALVAEHGFGAARISQRFLREARDALLELALQRGRRGGGLGVVLAASALEEHGVVLGLHHQALHGGHSLLVF